VKEVLNAVVHNLSFSQSAKRGLKYKSTAELTKTTAQLASSLHQYDAKFINDKI